ncbi:MAG: peptidylprolyl isomerase [Capsulimonadaceae bacterium]|nr:peptidylprolyl isomerase [Capsulimonadaceae bacterium]
MGHRRFRKLLTWVFGIVAVISLIGNALLYARYSSRRVLVRVNGETIVKKDLDDRLDFLYSRGLLTQMIWRALVFQEASRRDCLPTAQDIDDAMQDISRRDPVALLEAQKSDKALNMYKDTLRLNLALRNLRVADVTATEAEGRQYYKDHPDEFVLPRRLLTTAVVARDTLVRDQVKRMLTDGVAADNVGQTPGVRLVDLDSGLGGELSDSLRDQIKVLSQGDTASFPYEGHYLVVRVNSVVPPELPSFEELYPKVMMAAKLAKAPSATDVLLDIRRRASIVCESEKYAAAVPPAVVTMDGPRLK